MKAARLARFDARRIAVPAAPRLRIDVVRSESAYATLADELAASLTTEPKSIPTKYLYDDRGSKLFDAICDLPEYYPTRTELALLQQVAGEIVERTQPSDVIEFGSGTSRKTRVLLSALERAGMAVRYMPMDVNEWMMRRTAVALLREYPALRVHGVVGDYNRDLGCIPKGTDRLVVFLGSTVGNLTPAATVEFLDNVRARLVEGEHLLLGVDLVKPVDVLEAAYNDSAGVTAEFNLNILNVLNRELDADFDLDDFEHVAYFDAEASQIEIFLEARRAHSVSIGKLGRSVAFARGERVQTEISRKFTRESVQNDLTTTGYQLDRWYTPPNGYFGLALARAV
jgi:L-histidine N-alpha-methyltransferase